jgi:hypothetical protein
MTVFWPGLIIGVLLVAISIIGFRKRKAVARFSEEWATWTLGEKTIKKLGGSEANRKPTLCFQSSGPRLWGWR